MMLNLASVEMEPAFTRQKRARSIGRGSRFTQCRPPLLAWQAVATTRDKCAHDMVTRSQISDARSHLDYLTRRFMAECHRHGSRAAAVDHGQVGVTETGCPDADEDFAGAWCIEIECLNF
ncbi:hypothetical protein GCM10025859_31750 [Alicyclobacillus fastidiosus]|nr:hypothetical protein GCM10025859_31750 [Alicyclobacillus fastidiosus]